MLTNSKGEKSYFRAKGDKLEMLDRNGSPIQSPLNYTTEPVKASLPTTPMAMRGMYFYMADAATLPIARPVNASRWRTMPSLNGIMPPRAGPILARYCWW